MVLTTTAPPHLFKRLNKIYYTQLFWVFENHVICQCQGLFPRAFSSAEKSPGREVVPWQPCEWEPELQVAIVFFQDVFVQRLGDAVAIKSVSAWTEEKYRNEIVKMVNRVRDVCYSITFPSNKG